MTTGVRREERRLRRVLKRALWIAAATPIAIPFACSSQDTSSKRGSGEDAAGHPISVGSGEGSAMSGGASDGDPVDASCAPEPYTPDPPVMCGNYMRLPCGLPPGIEQVGDCFFYLNDCGLMCPGLYFNCHVVDNFCVDGGIMTEPTGAVLIDCVTCPGAAGRVPAGLARARRARAASALGEYFAVTTHLEAASVHAFRRLHGELAAHRAPARLLRAARRAQRDEVRHARLAGRMARRFGGAPVRPHVKPLAPRGLDVVAIENAVEGCVRETFGALVVSFQAANARDPEIARLMASIARDETRHAALSWAIARWAWRRLDAEARAALVAQCRGAIESLRRAADTGVADDLVVRAGLPNAEQHRALVGALEEQLWSSLRS
jgi:hypothetical protein